jgi:hypothetical protein
MSVGHLDRTMQIAFDAVAVASSSRSMLELERGVRPALLQLGFDRFGGVDVLPQAEQPLRIRHAFGAPVTDWVAHCKACGPAACDPMHDEVMRSTEPFFWSELSARRGGLTRREHEVLRRARGSGVRDVLTIPEHRPTGVVGAVHLISTADEPSDPNRRVAAHLIGVYYAAAARKFTTGRPPGSSNA